MSNQYQIANLSTLLEKMTSVDKDFRFMATNDLMTELQNDSIKLDDDSERKVNLIFYGWLFVVVGFFCCWNFFCLYRSSKLCSNCLRTRTEKCKIWPSNGNYILVFFRCWFVGFFLMIWIYSLGPLVVKVKEFQVELIVDTLCTNMLSEKEQLKDISSIGLKTVISQLPVTTSQMSSSIVKKITGRLLNAIQKVWFSSASSSSSTNY